MSGAPFALALLADVHFHDPEADFGGAGLMVQGQRLALRSWHDIRAGARAVNESAGALREALRRIADEGLCHVILAGDYTDDGQQANTQALAELLTRAEDEMGLRFYALPGNHDVFALHGKACTTRFVTAPGRTQLVTSDADLAAGEAGALYSQAMHCAGLPQALGPMARFGYFRQTHHLHWESPFGPDDAPEARRYPARAPDGSVTHWLMDASYLVEPEPGLWLLMLDANVFEPCNGRHDPRRKKAFQGASNAGWTAVLRVKPFLLDWIADVTARARQLGKTLIPVSHYPVLDPFAGDMGAEEALFGQTTLLRRTPGAAVGRALIGAGLGWHFGGHMHFNLTRRIEADDGAGLTDVALPSLSTFPGAFKILRAGGAGFDLQTVTLDDLTPDPRIAALYQAEGAGPAAPDHGAFLLRQRRAHLAERRLPREWPPEVLAWLEGRSAADLMPQSDLPQTDPPMPGLADCPLRELVVDAYLVKEAGALGAAALSPERLEICRVLARRLGDAQADPADGAQAFLARFLWVLGRSLEAL